MGRRRKTNRHLPARVYFHHGTHWFRPKTGKMINLGKDIGDAITAYAKLVSGAWSGRTVGDVLDRYLIEITPTKRSAQTQINETRAVARLKSAFGHMHPDSVTPVQLYEYMDKRRSSSGKLVPIAAHREMSLLSHAFTKAIRWGAATRNPAKGLEYGPRSPKRRQVTLEEINAVRAMTNERIRIAIDLAISTGQRRGDLLTLRRSQLTDEGILFRQSKTGAGVLILWSDDLKAIVGRAKALPPQLPAEYLIRQRSGQPYTSSGFSAIWTRLMAKHVTAGGQRFSFHDLRSVSADGAATVEEARDRLGHASAVTTQRHYRRAVTKVKPMA